MAVCMSFIFESIKFKATNFSGIKQGRASTNDILMANIHQNKSCLMLNSVKLDAFHCGYVGFQKR